MTNFSPHEIELERRRRRIYSVLNTDLALQHEVRLLDDRWVIARTLAAGLGGVTRADVPERIRILLTSDAELISATRHVGDMQRFAESIANGLADDWDLSSDAASRQVDR
jgi:hypothetical protein